MSFLFGQKVKPTPPPKTAGIDHQRFATNEQGVILPYFAGRRRLKATWLGQATNQRTVAVNQRVGKSNKVVGYKYFADVAALFGHGPAEALHRIWLDNEVVWEGTLTRGGVGSPAEHYVSVTVKDRGVLRFYWGTATSPFDSLLGPQGHPAYRDQVYLVWPQMFFGQDRTSAPNLEVEVSRLPSTPLTAAVEFDHDIHLPHAGLELLTSTNFGLGWDPAETIDLDSWDAATAALADEEVAASPLIDRDEPARNVMGTICEYCDAVVTAPGSAGGKLALTLIRPFRGSTSGLTLWGEFDLVEPPVVEPSQWEEVKTEAFTRFSDRQYWFESDSEPSRTLVAANILGGESRAENLDREWITSRAQARRHGDAVLRTKSLPSAKVTVRVRRHAAMGKEVGQFVRVTWENWGYTLLVRLTRRRVESDRSMTVEFEGRAEGYTAAVLPYVEDPPPVPVPDYGFPDPGSIDGPGVPAPPVEAHAIRIVELPRLLLRAEDDPTRSYCAALVARGSLFDVRADAWLSIDGGTSYRDVAGFRAFAVRGTLAADVAVAGSLDPNPVVVDLTGPDGRASIFPPLDDHAAETLDLLLFVGDEIMAAGAIAIVTATQISISGVRRGIADTLSAAHATGAEVFLMPRSGLVPFSDPQISAGRSVHWKVTPGNHTDILDLADADAIAQTLTGRTPRPLAPLDLLINRQGLTRDIPALIGGGASRDVLLQWTVSSWDRPALEDGLRARFWDEGVRHVLTVRNAATSAVAREVQLGPGVQSWTYRGTEIDEDFGSEPAGGILFEIRAIAGGLRSTGVASALVMYGSGGGPACWSSAGFASVIGAQDAFTVLYRNFYLAAAVFGVLVSEPPLLVPGSIAYPPQSLFYIGLNTNLLAAAAGITLLDPTDSLDPEWALQVNFERLAARAAAIGRIVTFRDEDPPTSGPFSATAGDIWVRIDQYPQPIWRFNSIAGAWQVLYYPLRPAMLAAVAQPITLQGDFDPVTTYQSGDVVTGSDGNAYQAIGPVFGVSPISNRDRWIPVNEP